jgi:hypothetical protein
VAVAVAVAALVPVPIPADPVRRGKTSLNMASVAVKVVPAVIAVRVVVRVRKVRPVDLPVRPQPDKPCQGLNGSAQF